MTAFPQVGEIFDGQFELLDILSVDEQNTVFKAVQLDCKRKVAIKILHFDAAAENSEFRRRILHEAKALCRSRHANVVKIYRIAVSEFDLPYIVMELLKGRSVRQRLDSDGAFSVQSALIVIARCADALQHAHQSGIVHRDLKPESIIVRGEPEHGIVKLTDFGFARLETMRNQSLTSTGILIGSFNYMSPEQCLGQKVDTRSDIYALCACLYEMLTASKAYLADNELALLSEHLNSPAPQIEEHQLSSFDGRINKLLAKGMALNPNRRYKTMAELARDIEILRKNWGQTVD